MLEFSKAVPKAVEKHVEGSFQEIHSRLQGTKGLEPFLLNVLHVNRGLKDVFGQKAGREQDSKALGTRQDQFLARATNRVQVGATLPGSSGGSRL